MNVGVADTTVLDVNGNVLGPCHVPLDRDLRELDRLGILYFIEYLLYHFEKEQGSRKPAGG